MRARPARIVACLLIGVLLPMAVGAEEVHLFVMAGQSNMQGWQGDGDQYPPDPSGMDRRIRFYWVTPQFSSSGGAWTHLQPQGGRFPGGHFGPETTFARTLLAAGHPVAIFKYSLGSTSLAHCWKEPGQRGMYDEMVAELRGALALLEQQGHRPVFKALVWIQGESDADGPQLAESYGDRLKMLIRHFRTEVARNDHLPIILGLDEEHAWVREYPQVLQAQKRLAAEDPHTAFTSMIGLEKADGAHLSPRGLEEHGHRLFAAYQRLTGQDGSASLER